MTNEAARQNTSTSPFAAQTVDRLYAILNSTPQGQALLNGLMVLPITALPRTDVVGVAQGSVNIYRDGASRYLQVFDMEGTGSPNWWEIEMTPA